MTVFPFLNLPSSIFGSYQLADIPTRVGRRNAGFAALCMVIEMRAGATVEEEVNEISTC